MLKFFGDIWSDIVDAVRWFFSPHAWRIASVVVLNLGILVALGYFAIQKYDYGREAFSRCPGSKNLIFISEFFAFTFFALFALATVGEILNWVDDKRSGRPTPKLTAMLSYGTLTGLCGAVALVLVVRCA